MFKPFGIFLLSLFMFTQVYNTAMWVNYELNTEVITDLFCENTDKPEMNCHGVCHLKKQVINQEQDSPVESNQQFYINEIQLFSSNEEITLSKVSEEVVSHSFYENDLYSFLTENSLFHPPKV